MDSFCTLKINIGGNPMFSNPIAWVIIVIVAFLVALVIGFVAGNAYRKNIAEAKIGKVISLRLQS